VPLYRGEKGMTNDPLEISEATSQAESVLLGAILIESAGDGSNEAIRKISTVIKPSDFRGCNPTDKPEHWVWRARFFYAMTKCTLPPHSVNLANKLAELELLQRHDVSLMAHCIWQVPCSLDYMHYAKAVKDYSIRRQIEYYASKGDIKQLHRLTKPEYEDGIKL
jgi:hypothetical protein